MAADSRLVNLLEQVFENIREESDFEDFDKSKWDFAFHMTDWQADLNKLHAMYANPADWEPESACKFLVGFLFHVVPHLNAAARLLVGSISDPFSQQDGS